MKLFPAQLVILMRIVQVSSYFQDIYPSSGSWEPVQGKKSIHGASLKACLQAAWGSTSVYCRHKTLGWPSHQGVLSL